MPKFALINGVPMMQQTGYAVIPGDSRRVKLGSQDAVYEWDTNGGVFYNRPETPILYEFMDEKGTVQRLKPKEFFDEFSVDVGGDRVIAGAPNIRVIVDPASKDKSWTNPESWELAKGVELIDKESFAKATVEMRQKRQDALERVRKPVKEEEPVKEEPQKEVEAPKSRSKKKG